MNSPATSPKCALLPYTSTLKLVSLPLASGASLCLTLCPPSPTNNEVLLYRKGGRNHKRNCRIPHLYKPPPTFYTKAKVAQGGAYLRDTTVHCTKKYWGINTTFGKYEHARQFYTVAMPFYPSCLAPPAVAYTLFCSSIGSSHHSLGV